MSNVIYADSTAKLYLTKQPVSITDAKLISRLTQAGVVFNDSALIFRKRKHHLTQKKWVNKTLSVYLVTMPNGTQCIQEGMKDFVARNFTESYGYVMNRLRQGFYRGYQTTKLFEINRTTAMQQPDNSAWIVPPPPVPMPYPRTKQYLLHQLPLFSELE